MHFPFDKIDMQNFSLSLSLSLSVILFLPPPPPPPPHTHTIVTLSLSPTSLLLAYPTAANPNGPPVITQIGTRHRINITNSIPSELSSDVGYSTLIVRVLDLSSTTTDDYTYFVLVSVSL